MLLAKTNTHEDEVATMNRFLCGMNKTIADVLELQPYVNMAEMVHKAIQIERQLNRRGNLRGSFNNSNSNWKTNPRREEKQVSRSKEEDTRPKPAPLQQFNKNSNDKGKGVQMGRSRDIKCFKCQGFGHIQTECPNRRVMYLVEGELYSGSDSEDSDDCNDMPDLEDCDDVEGCK